MLPQNAFQDLMQQWPVLGPYNAIHLLKLNERPDPERIKRAILAAVAHLGIKLTVPVSKYYYGFIHTVTTELNRPFQPDEPPLRFFLLENKRVDFYLGVNFDHWIADSYSVRLLMKHVHFHLTRPAEAATLAPFAQSTESMTQLFGATNRLAALRECARNYFQHHRACRFDIHAPMDFSVSFRHQQLPDGLIGRLREYAKKLNAKTNDVFLAAATIALSRYARLHGERKKSRKHVAVSTAIDLRPFATKPMENIFGFYLGHFSVFSDKQETGDLSGIVPRIAKQTRDAKSVKRVLPLLYGFKLARFFWDRYKKPRSRALLFNRGMPILGGISNVNLTDSWIGREPGGMEYIRVSPAGPILPIVFTLTTIHDRLSLCVTTRNAVFSNEWAETVISDFAGQLTQFL